MLFPIVGGGPGDYFGAAIANACRFNDDDSAYLTRTPAASNRDLLTLSTWVKRGNLGLVSYLFSAGADGNNHSGLRFLASDELEYVHLDGGSVTDQVKTTAKYRDPAQHLHVVLRIDTANGTAANRIRLYVNGGEITDLAVANYPASGVDTDINSAAAHDIGRGRDASNYLDGCLAETILTDGQSLGPENFGETNPITGQWVPITYSGSYGTNGFHLDFADAGDLGNDTSGNANDFTSSGLATNDQVPDTPTDNYPTLSPVHKATSNITLSDGNLAVSMGGAGTWVVYGTIQLPKTGKWYFEVTRTSGAGLVAGITKDAGMNTTAESGSNNIDWMDTSSSIWRLGTEETSVFDAAPGTNPVMMLLDCDAGTFKFKKGGVEYVPTTDTFDAALDWWIFLASNADAGAINFGQLSLTNTPPAGYKALNTKNLSAPMIVDPSKYFQAHIYTGTGSAHSETFTGNSDLQPDLVWIKNRDQADQHKLVDAVRGATKKLCPNDANAEATEADGVTAFNTDGFALGTGAGGYNDSGEKFASWNWKEGTIPGFDIVTYTGTGVAHTESHSLGVVPDLIIVKSTAGSKNWKAYHSSNTSTPEDYALTPDLDYAKTDNTGWWNDTAPTSTVFTVGTHGDVNADTSTYMAYLWAEVEGFSKFGAYEGNGNADGAFVWCGFKPAYVLCKAINTTSTWNIFDNKREGYNVDNDSLFVDTTAAEGTADLIDLLSNGFKLRIGTDPNVAETYIFAAFAEAPFKYARAR